MFMKNNTITFFVLAVVSCLIFSCSSKSDVNRKSGNSISSYYSDEEDENSEYNLGCKYDDGTYSATVDYNNPETGYSATYTLDVEVQDCQVVQINFPNDGYLDEDHISYADIDEDGNASVDGEEGKTYEIQIDN
jgi:hypothetical protein